MVAAQPTPGELSLDRLLHPPVRWGYEFVLPAPPSLSPERKSPPQTRQPKLVPRARAAGLRKAMIMCLVAGVAVIVLYAQFGEFDSHSKNTHAGVISLVNLGGAIIAFVAARDWRRYRRSGDVGAPLSIADGWLIPGINALVTLFLALFTLPIEGIIAAMALANGSSKLVPNPSDLQKVQTEYQEAVSAWQQRIVQFESAEQTRYETTPVWYPVGTSGSARMICVFGGTYISWAAVLSTLGATVLGAGLKVLVGDLSRRRSLDPLVDLCQHLELRGVLRPARRRGHGQAARRSDVERLEHLAGRGPACGEGRR